MDVHEERKIAPAVVSYVSSIADISENNLKPSFVKLFHQSHKSDFSVSNKNVWQILIKFCAELDKSSCESLGMLRAT